MSSKTEIDKLRCEVNELRILVNQILEVINYVVLEKTKLCSHITKLNMDLLHCVLLRFEKTNHGSSMFFKINKRCLAFKNILKHPTYGPSIRNHFTLKSIYEDGVTTYQLNSQFHREYDQPAIVYTDGRKEWWQHGQCHRDGDLPAIVYTDGRKEWWKHDQCHRDGDQPAIVYTDGYKEWWQHGQRHRDGDLPAVIYPDGST